MIVRSVSQSPLGLISFKMRCYGLVQLSQFGSQSS